MLSLPFQNEGFPVTFLKSNQGWITGHIWQIAIMRENFERFGEFICMDTMKQYLTDIDWPYISISIYSELNSVCLAREGMVCGERVEAYNAMLQFVLCHNNNNEQKKEDIIVAHSGRETYDIHDISYG